MADTYYRVNDSDVTAENFDGEVLAINLSTGRYHSIRGRGAWLWRVLMAGQGRGEALRRLAASAPESECLEQAEAFINELVAENIIIISDAGGSDPGWPTGNDWEVPPISAEPFLESFSDMQDLLEIDPIHEVDARGWPHVAGDGET